MTTGVLPWVDMRKALLLNTGFFETSQFTEDTQMYVTSGNWDNAGLSIGMLQYNYGAADRASELFTYMLNNHDSVVQAVFGSYTTQYTDFRNVNLTYTRTDKVTWANGISDWTAGVDGHALQAPWKDILGRLAQTAECKVKYYDMFEAYYLPSALDLFKQYNCTSRAAFCSLFDIYNNRGRYYPVATLQWDFEQIDADNTKDAVAKETAKIQAINDRGNDNTNAINVTTWLSRRTCMRNQGGDYFGATYDPETQFDVNQEPAIPEKVAGLGAAIKLGTVTVNNVTVGGVPVASMYLGANLIGNAALTPYTTSKVPNTQARTNNNSYVGYESGALSVNQGNKVWMDVQEPFAVCRIYYTTDGTTPTTASTRYTDGIVFNTAGTFTLKTLAVSLSGVSEAVKTFTVTVAVAPVTTISPSTIVQNNIPITVTLTGVGEAGTTIKYKLGTSATEYTYTGPFTVNQNSTGVASTQIKVTYWGIGATITETAKSITYDTSASTPAAPIPNVANGNNKVSLSWAATANTTSYTIYRSTTSGTLGSILSQYQSGTTYVDTTALNGTTYYYTVQAGNYGHSTNSAQVTGVPTALPASMRYLKLQGYGSNVDATTRLIEFEAYSGATNRMAAATILSSDAPNNTGTAAQIKDALFGTGSNTYPLWWTAVPNANVVIDLGASYAIDTLKWYGYSIAGDQRQNKFKVLGSNTNNGTDWVTLWNMSTNTIVQPVLPSGYSQTL